MSAPRKGRRKPTTDTATIPTDTLGAALPRVAEDYAQLIAHPPQGDPSPDPKAVIAHYAAADAVLSHLMQLTSLAAATGAATEEAGPDALLAAARADLAAEKEPKA
jgi:hypothetical protein